MSQITPSGELFDLLAVPLQQNQLHLDLMSPFDDMKDLMSLEVMNELLGINHGVSDVQQALLDNSMDFRVLDDLLDVLEAHMLTGTLGLVLEV